MRIGWWVAAVALAGCSGTFGRADEEPLAGECLPLSCDGRCGVLDDGCGQSVQCAGCTAGTCGGGGQANVCGHTTATSVGPRIVGRMDESVGGQPLLAFPGSEVQIQFRGTRLAVTLEHKSNGSRHRDVLSVGVDGGAPFALTLTPGTETYVLADALPDAEHLVRIVKRTEAMVGSVRIVAVDAPGGALLPAPAPRPRRMLFLGDSITAGYGVLGQGPRCPFTSAEEDFTSTYAARVGATFDADVVAVAVSGIGVLRNDDGSASQTMREVFERAAPPGGTSWDHSRFSPDVVVVSLGTNDFVTGTPERAAFVEAMTGLLRRVREVHPDVPLIVALSPMLSDSYPRGGLQRSTARDYLKEALDAVGGRAAFVEFAVQEEADGLGCDWHPGPTTHRKMALTLTAAIRDLMSW